MSSRPAQVTSFQVGLVHSVRRCLKQIGGKNKAREGEEALCIVEVPEGMHGTSRPHEPHLSASSHHFKSFSALPYPLHHRLHHRNRFIDGSIQTGKKVPDPVNARSSRNAAFDVECVLETLEVSSKDALLMDKKEHSASFQCWFCPLTSGTWSRLFAKQG